MTEPTGHPRNGGEARDYALAWVAILVARGYGPDKAEAEVFTGGGGAKTAGYSIFDGKIHIANCHRYKARPWSFPFRELANELTAPKQTELFNKS